jgi:two-component sensor kinase yesM
MKKINLDIFQTFSSKLNSVYKKLVFMTLLCSILPLTIVSIISYVVSYTISKSHTIDSLKATNTQIALNIDNRLSQIEQLSSTISFYLYSLYNTPLMPLSSYLNEFSNSKKNLGAIKNAFNLFQIDVFLPQDHYIDTLGNRIDFFPLSSISEYNMTLDSLYEQGSSPIWCSNQNLQFPASFMSNPQNVYTCWYSYRNINQKTLHYAFACHIKQEEFSNILSNNQNFNTHSFVIDSNNTIVMNADETLISTDIEKYGNILWNAKQNAIIIDQSLFVVQPIAKRNLLLVTQIPVSYINQSSNIILAFLFFSIILIFCFSIFFNAFASKIFTHRLDTLTKVMKSRENISMLNSMINKPCNIQDEIDHLAVIYKQMITENDAYYKKLLEITLQTEKLKFQLLQSQINPHFLFNTLNAIVSCQLLGEFEIAQQTLQNLSQFYHHLLYNPDSLVTIKEELFITDLYLKLISVTKTNSITWDFSLDDGVDNFYICKFVFQPFVENSITHGIINSTQPLHICIDIHYEDDSIFVQITDNGIGMSSAQKDVLMEAFEQHIVDYKKNFGLENVNVRLTPYFAPPCSCIKLKYSNTHGTCFFFNLQQLIKEELQ